MTWSWENIRSGIERHRIVYGVILSLLVSILLTVISMALYVSSGASRLDLSRPGYERVRSNLQNDTEESRFSATGPMNQGVVNDFQARFSKHRETLGKLDSFGTGAIEDAELQIAADAPQQ